jgi:hypothetical protein
MLGRGRCTRSAAPPPPVPPAGPGPVTATRPSPPAAGRHACWGAAGPARTAPGIGRGPTPGTHPNARRSPRGRRPPPPTPAAGPQQLRQLNAAWLSMRVRLPRNAIDSSRARTLTRIGVAWLPQADQREVTTCRRAAEGSAVGDGQRDDRAPAEVVAAGLAGGVRSTCRSARRPRSRGHPPSSSAQWVSASRPSRTPGSTGRSHETAPAALPLVRGRTDEPLCGGRPEPLLPDPGQAL